MEWFEYPYPRPELMNRWSLARHSEVMGEKFESETSKKKFDAQVHSLLKSFRSGSARADLRSLFECLYAAVKMEQREDPACKERPSFTQLYSEGLHSLLENYIHEPPCWKKAPNENDIVLYCMALTADLAKCVLKSLHITQDTEGIAPGRINNAIAIVRSLTTAVDRQSLFHKLNRDRRLPPWILFRPRRYTSTVALQQTTPSSQQNRSYGQLDSERHASNNPRGDDESWSCGCGRCSTSPEESSLWINILLEHFGHGSGCAGFDVFLDILVSSSRLETVRGDILQLCESILHYLSTVMEFLKEEKKAALVQPCLRMQGAISRWHHTSQLADKNLIGTVTLIAQRVRFILGPLLPSGMAEAVMGVTNKELRDLLISFQSSETTSAIASSQSSPRTILGGKSERRHVTATDTTTARVIKEEVSTQMQQFTNFVSAHLAMPIATLQPGSVMKITQLSEADGSYRDHDHCELSYPNPPSLTTTEAIEVSLEKIAESLAESSPPRSSAALGATMRNAKELVAEFKILSRSPPEECETDGRDDNFIPDE